MDYVPASALANPNFTLTKCPNQKCGEKLVVRVHVTFTVEVDEAFAFDKPCTHEWHHYEGDHFEACKLCDMRQEAARER